jgi:hypothetical protein
MDGKSPARRTCLAILGLAIVACGGLWSCDAQSRGQRPLDDSKVLAAVIEHSVRPEVIARRRGPADSEVPVIIFENNVPTCGRAALAPCVRSLSIGTETFDSGARSSLFDWSPAAPSVSLEVRQELLASFRARNAESRRLPQLDSVGLEPVPQAALSGLDESSNDRQGRVKGYAAFSLPGYSRDDRALMYAMFMCGGRCGFEWLFVLNREAADWRVASRRLLSIR